jgi:hypothetical protein
MGTTMARRLNTATLALAGALALAGCAEGGLGTYLRDSGIAQTPDEFMVLPTRPLEMPANLSALPPPTPGAPNRVDYQPNAEAVAGLTGRQGTARTADGGAIVARTGAGSPGIRQVVAIENAEYAADNPGKLLERWFSRDQTALTYRGQTLDAASNFEAMRAQGVGVPMPPPALLQPE